MHFFLFNAMRVLCLLPSLQHERAHHHAVPEHRPVHMSNSG